VGAVVIECRLDNNPIVATAEWHHDRERANHLDQPGHGERMRFTASAVRLLVDELAPGQLVDLGAGDGGTLELIGPIDGVRAWGYDFTPANVAGARERGVDVRCGDFLERLRIVGFARPTVVILAEVLEHLYDPHGLLALLWADPNVVGLVASSPYNEVEGPGYEGHLWAWDVEGYEALISAPGFAIAGTHATESGHTIVAAVRP
jgi:2-polyprenyl-3-methyl-5-hydroxy-6-metoxy-1,4-benzoquinol methylase